MKSKESILPPVDAVIDQAREISHALGTSIGFKVGTEEITLIPGKPIGITVTEEKTAQTKFDLVYRISQKLGRRVTYIETVESPSETPGFTIKEPSPKR